VERELSRPLVSFVAGVGVDMDREGHRLNPTLNSYLELFRSSECFGYNPAHSMAIAIGQQLGSYEITALIGKGGMGEVYRARDTKLDRSVAVKILPEAFAQNPDRIAQFDREAKVLASLNHPNIATLHGKEESEGKHTS